jgi:hypothetical protein
MKFYFGILNDQGQPFLETQMLLLLGYRNITAGADKLELLRSLIDPMDLSKNTEKDLDAYMIKYLSKMNEFFGRDLKTAGETLEERVTSFFDLMVENRFGCFLED